MSPRKITFFAVAAILIIALGIGFSMLANKKAGDTKKGAKTITAWVVGDDSAGYEEVIKGFKSRFEQYKDTDVKIVKFANYNDYEKTLLSVIADGNSPDLFVIPSDGSSVLETKAELIPNEYISTEEFSRNFLRIFDDLIISDEVENDKWEKVRATYVKGVPMSYESPAVFYNRDLVSNAVPRTWSELVRNMENPTFSDSSTPPADFTLAGLGLGSKYVQNSPDILTLMFVQNGITSYSWFSEAGAKKALDQYLAFGLSPVSDSSSSVISYNETLTGNGNDLAKNKEEMDRLGLTATDLFARGKIGFVIGYPSFLREIQYAIKRTNGDSVFNKKNLKTTNIPVGDGERAYNLARYQYFALSKTAKEQQTALDFLAYLSTKTAQEAYLAKFPYALPAMTELQEARKDQVFEREYPWVKYESFLPVAGIELATFQKGHLPEYNAFFGKALDEKSGLSKNILDRATRVISCNHRHLVEWQNFEEDCERIE